MRAAIILAVLLAATPAAAQQAQPTEMDSYRVPGWSFTPGFVFGVVRDTNVALADAPADIGRTESDSLFTINPFGTLEYVGRRTEFSGGYRGFVRRYQEVEGLNSYDQRLFVSLRRLATKRLTFFLRNEFNEVPTTDEVEVNGVPFRRIGAQTNTFSASAEARLSKFTTMNVRYENTWVQFDREEQTLEDDLRLLRGGFLNGIRADVRHGLNERMSVGAEYGLRLASMNDGLRELTFQDVGGVLHYDLGPQTELFAAGGMSFLRDRTLGNDRSGPYVRAAIAHATQHVLVGANYERTFLPAFGFGGSSTSQEVRGWVHMPIPRNRMYWQGSVSWRQSDPLEDTLSLDLDTILIRSTVGYALTRWLRGEGFYAFTRQDSRVTGGEINRHRAGAQLVISQPMRLR